MAYTVNETQYNEENDPWQDLINKKEEEKIATRNHAKQAWLNYNKQPIT